MHIGRSSTPRSAVRYVLVPAMPPTLLIFKVQSSQLIRTKFLYNLARFAFLYLFCGRRNYFSAS